MKVLPIITNNYNSRNVRQKNNYVACNNSADTNFKGNREELYRVLGKVRLPNREELPFVSKALFMGVSDCLLSDKNILAKDIREIINLDKMTPEIFAEILKTKNDNKSKPVLFKLDAECTKIATDYLKDAPDDVLLYKLLLTTRGPNNETVFADAGVDKLKVLVALYYNEQIPLGKQFLKFERLHDLLLRADNDGFGTVEKSNNEQFEYWASVYKNKPEHWYSQVCPPSSAYYARWRFHKYFEYFKNTNNAKTLISPLSQRLDLCTKLLTAQSFLGESLISEVCFPDKNHVLFAPFKNNLQPLIEKVYGDVNNIDLFKLDLFRHNVRSEESYDRELNKVKSLATLLDTEQWVNLLKKKNEDGDTPLIAIPRMFDIVFASLKNQPDKLKEVLKIQDNNGKTVFSHMSAAHSFDSMEKVYNLDHDLLFELISDKDKLYLRKDKDFLFYLETSSYKQRYLRNDICKKFHLYYML
ncbi:MAG: hypothetical protein MJ237_05785 [bacterium]|nr:hypothetical protein [bacterium]